MTDEIIEKLNNISLNYSKTEAETVYIIVEIRKILERDGLKYKDYKLINFYGNWVVHCIIDKPDNTREYFKEICDLLEKMKGEGINLTDYNFRLIYNKISFLELKNEFINFFERYNINKNLLYNYWEYFLRNLISIISDCYLVYNNIRFVIKKDSSITYCIEIENNIFPYIKKNISLDFFFKN